MNPQGALDPERRTQCSGGRTSIWPTTPQHSTPESFFILVQRLSSNRSWLYSRRDGDGQLTFSEKTTNFCHGAAVEPVSVPPIGPRMAAPETNSHRRPGRSSRIDFRILGWIADVGKRLSGNRWHGLAWALLGLSLVSTIVALAFWFFGLDLDDYETTNFREVHLQSQLVLAGALLLPGLSAAAAIRSMFVPPRRLSRVIASCLVLLLAAVVFWFCCTLGFSAIEHASRTVLRHG